MILIYNEKRKKKKKQKKKKKKEKKRKKITSLKNTFNAFALTTSID